jgi:hypothetical protein
MTLRRILSVTVAAAIPLAILSSCTSEREPEIQEVRETTPLHDAARNGEKGPVESLINDGEDPNARDEVGKTPLHWSASNGHGQTSAALISGGADPSIVDDSGMTPLDHARANGHDGTASVIAIAAAGPLDPSVRTINPGANFQDLAAFETAIGGPAVLLRSENVWLFAPKSREEAANIVHPYLVGAYDALHEITGVHTEYIMAIYNLPEGHKDAFGGTKNCSIYYGDRNLRMDEHEEWQRFRIPHVSGYIEEMGHNFVDRTGVQFGWEMVGWSIGIQASTKVAGNRLFAESVANTRSNQLDTFERYRRGGFVLPDDVPSNLVDRLHAHLLGQYEQEYGPAFWPDFFEEVNRNRSRFEGATDRDERYRISLACFDALEGVNMSERLRANEISVTTDIKSLNPTKPGWNRRLK